MYKCIFNIHARDAVHSGRLASVSADVSWRMPTYDDVCWRMLKYADVCWRMSTRCAPTSQSCCGICRHSVYFLYWYKSTNTDAWGAAGVAWRSNGYWQRCKAVSGLRRCWRMLTYADVCWRMLTYADVCCVSLQRLHATTTHVTSYYTTTRTSTKVD